MTDDAARSRRAFLRRAGLGAASLVGGGLAAKVARAERRPDDATHLDRPDRGASSAAGAPAIADDGAACALHDDLPRDADPAVRAFLGAVGPGTILGGAGLGAWQVARVHAVFRGALPFVLARADGRKAQVDLMRHDDGSPAGIAAIRAGHLYLVNAGRGATFTPPDLEAAIHALGRALADRDGGALALASFAERQRCHPGGVFVVPM